MNIIVVGIGKVGYTVAEQLSQEMHDVTIIDTNENVINDTLQDIDVIGVIGNGAISKTLTDAGVGECDLLIALTGSDELNILSCLLAIIYKSRLSIYKSSCKAIRCRQHNCPCQKP